MNTVCVHCALCSMLANVYVIYRASFMLQYLKYVSPSGQVLNGVLSGWHDDVLLSFQS